MINIKIWGYKITEFKAFCYVGCKITKGECNKEDIKSG